MSSPEKKRKTTVLAPMPESTSNPPLPDDLLLSCLARVSRLYYTTLSFVSKRFRSLLASPELYKTRSLLGRTESCLYVYLQLTPNSNPRWFTLCRKPLTNGHVLVALPIPDSPLALWSGLVALGSNIYNFGRSSVSILDCRTHTWHEGPSMRVEREHPTANVLNGKIYVTGGCKECNSSNFMEVLDPKTQTWEPKSNPLVKRSGCRITLSAVINGEILMYGDGGRGGVTYKPEEDRWEELRARFLRVSSSSWCVIDNVIYHYGVGSRIIKWYDFARKSWKCLKGVPDFPGLIGCVKLVNYGGKMAVFWDVYGPSRGYQNTMTWYAVIALERRNSEEVWGNVEWFDVVLTVPKEYRIVGGLTAIV